MNNSQLLKYSIKNPEKALDKNYMFLSIHKDLNSYVRNSKRIKEILIQIKRQPTEKLYTELSTKIKYYGNFSEFGAFINACDSSVKHVAKDIGLLKKIVAYYFKHRKLTSEVSEEWIQALADQTSSRKKGQRGEDKLIGILKNKGYFYATNFDDLSNKSKSVMKFKKDTIKQIKQRYKQKIGENNQNKNMDLCIKKGTHTYILEAKHLSNKGGGQNKQITELIDIIKKKVDNSKSHFVSFLDGIYFNLLFEEKKIKKIQLNKFRSVKGKDKNKKIQKAINKLENQKNSILDTLDKRPTNYFINTAGFEKLFS